MNFAHVVLCRVLVRIVGLIGQILVLISKQIFINKDADPRCGTNQTEGCETRLFWLLEWLLLGLSRHIERASVGARCINRVPRRLIVRCRKDAAGRGILVSEERSS